ncbi:toll/interleukin-1 receptor domain-containing protein [Pseudolabrys taiwanensis]|nr:toll/interleukin-1 receptor domain-containing protein [Pseudolabrys taiwanensis]
MKAFLSHSSRDKATVEQVAAQLGAANVELDSETFDRGLLNVTAIQDALRRSSLFILFLSKDALASGVVRYEALLAQELFARGIVERFLVICLDENSFSSADDNWKTFNFVRKATSPQSIARLIQHQIILLQSKLSGAAQPFVGRLKELGETKEKLIDPKLTRLRGIYVSGFAGTGRRTFARRLFSDIYPSVISVFPEISIEELDGLEEIYRKLSEKLAPNSTLSAYRTRILAFATETEAGKEHLIVQLLERAIDTREAVLIIDHGGLLDRDGQFQSPVRQIIARLPPQRRPCVVFIAERMMPQARQRDTEGLIFCRLSSLSFDETKQLIGLMLRNSGITYTENDLAELANLSDGHPFNVAFLVEAVKHYGIKIILGDPSEITQWKRRRASDFLTKIAFSPEEQKIISALNHFNVLDFEILVQVSGGDSVKASNALAKLIDYHVVEIDTDTFSIALPLRIAVRRDKRFDLSGEPLRALLSAVGGILTAKAESDEIAAPMVEGAILARLQEGGEIPTLFSAFLLPSHLVWLARRRYDAKKFDESISLARSALNDSGRLSPAGRVEASRILCLASARLGQEANFQYGIDILKANANDSWARSNLNFLLGFMARMRGHLPEAETFMRKAYDDAPGNFSAAHGLASICLVRGNLSDAEKFARKAFEVAPDNAYVLDVLLRILFGDDPHTLKRNESEINYLLERLKAVGEEEGKSFYTTRRADYEFRTGNLSEACKLIDEAAHKTPGIFNVHELRAKIYLERGNKTIAAEEIQKMRDVVYRPNTSERLTNLRVLLETEASYYSASGMFDEAKKIYKRKDVFTDVEATAAVRKIEIEQGYRNR